MEDLPYTFRHCKQGKSDTWWRTSADEVNIDVTPTGTRRQSGLQLTAAGSFATPHLERRLLSRGKKHDSLLVPHADMSLDHDE